jgi:flagellin-like protein
LNLSVKYLSNLGYILNAFLGVNRVLEDDKIRFKHFWKDREGVSPVIAVILLVAMTVVLVAVLYYTVSGMVDETKITPVAALGFREHETIEGQYTGGIVSISSKVYLKEVSLTIVDVETGTSEVIQPLADGESVSIGNPGSEITVTFDDAGKPGLLESSDVFFITGATFGDKLILIYIPSDDLLDTWETPL